MKRKKTTEQLLKENQELRIRLAEAEETLRAIREGEVDAVIVKGSKGEQVFTLTGEEIVYRNLVETMSEAGLTTTPEGRILFCNERFSIMLRRPMEEIVGHTIEEFIQKSHHKDIASLLKGAQVNLSRKRLTFIAGDGTVVPSRVSANLLTQRESVSICMVAMDLTELEASEEIIRQIQEQKEALEESSAALRDSQRAALNIMEDALSARQKAESLNVELRREVNERKQTEEALRQSQEDLSRAQEVGNTGSWRMDIQHNQLTWSVENHRIFGIPKGTPMTYETFLSTIHPDDREYVDTKWKAALAGEPYDIEHRTIVDGQIKWVREKAYLEFDKDGALLGGFGITQDITTRKNTEQALQKMNEELERRVTERTSQLSNTVEALQEEVAERIKAEKESREKSDILDALFTSTTSPLVLLDRNFNFIRVSDTYAKACQRNISEFEGHNHFEFYPHTENQAIFEEVVRTKKPYTAIAKPFEFPDHPEWGVSYWDWTLFPLLDENGEVEFLVFSLENVTERKQAEETLRSVSLYARGLLEASLDPMITISHEGKITDINKATEQVTGIERESLIGSDFSNYFTEPQKAKEGYQKVWKEGLVRDYPLTIRHTTGKTTDVLYNATLYRNQAGQIQGVFAAARDMTEHKRMERALWESEQRYRGLTVATAQIIWTTNADGEVIEDIPSWREFTGQTSEQIRGWGWSEALHPDDIERTKAIWAQSVKKHKTYDTEYRIRGKDGNYRYFSVRGVPILEEDGTVREWVGTCTDITERKNAEIITKVTNRLLELFAQQSSRQEYLDSVTETISEWSGCRCTGVRILDEEGYISYASHKGFPKEFLELENNLSIKNDVCVCIRVITQQMDAPDKELMTSRGSFDCNDTSGFIEGLTKKEKKLFRGNCIRFGYASVCVVPIRYREKVLGAIHLADERPGMVPSEKVEFLENMALLVGEAVHRFDMEEELRESEVRYRQLVELSPDGVGVEIDGKIVFINNAGTKLLGAKSNEELIGKPIAEFIHPDFQRRSLKLLSYMRKKGVTLPPREAKFVRLDGTVFDVEVAATALMYKERNAAQIVFRDITDRKKAEKEIMDNQEKLRSLTAELVLAEERERRAAAMALHDSLGPILAFSKRELGLLQKTMSKKDADALKHISSNISNAVQQTRNLTFDLSPPTLYTFGLETAVAELAEKFAVEQNLQIAFEKGEGLKPLPDHLKVLLYRSVRELLINITKHSGASSIRLAISQADDNIKIVIEDNGKGIDMPMYAAKTFWTKGFGLFSIRERLTHVGGTIEIHSSREKGTVVTLLAPLEIENHKKEV